MLSAADLVAPKRDVPGRVSRIDHELRVVHAVEAESEDEVRSTLARDPWSSTHLLIDAIEPWTIRLDGRRS